MKSFILFLIASFFLSLVILSCKKEKQPTKTKEAYTIVSESKLPGSPSRYWCPQERNYFSISTANNGKLNWRIQNRGSFNQDYYMMTRHYLNGVETASWHAFGVNIPVWSEKTINIFSANEPRDRVFFLYTNLAQCPNSNCFTYAGPAVFNLKAKHHPGIWEISLSVTNGPDSQNYPDRQIVLDCWLNGVKKQSIPVRISHGLPLDHNADLMLLAEDGALMGANQFTVKFEDSYPN